MALTTPEPSPQERQRADEALARLINDNLMRGFSDEDGYPIMIEAREIRLFIKEHWDKISRYAHLIHGS